ncbi:MAG: carbohydrate kinase [Phycisphaerae bacterium]|nr:carbohydrate kinase [Phycisphaerae bacterium]
MTKYLLGIDNGGTVCKVGLFDLAGKELAIASNKTDVFSPKPDFFELDIEKMWLGTANAIKTVLDKTKIDPGDIVCIAGAGHGNGLYLIDENGKAIGNGIMSTDSRSKDLIKKWQSKNVHDKIYQSTGQSLWPGMTPAILAWLKENEPERLNKAKYILMCKDFIRSRLTGQYFSDITDMSGANLINLKKGQYDKDVLQAFGIEDIFDKLPPLKRPDDICGYVTEQAAIQTGLKSGTPVAGGLFDIDACALACGITETSQLCMVVGTWGNNQYIATEPVLDKDFFMSTCFCVKDYYLMLEGSPTSASNLEWFIKNIINYTNDIENIYDYCNQQVATTNPETSELIYLPFVYGSNVNPDAKGCFIGMDGSSNIANMLRAIYEGVIFSHKWHLERLLKFRKWPENIRLTGGGCRSEVWMQVFADCLGVPIEIPAGTELGTAGAAICGAVASKCYESYADAIDNMVKMDRKYLPDNTKIKIYENKYKRYKKTIEALDNAWPL